MKKDVIVAVVFLLCFATSLMGHGAAPYGPPGPGVLATERAGSHHSSLVQVKRVEGSSYLLVLENLEDKGIPSGSTDVSVGGDTVTVELFLASVSDTLTFNQNHVPDNYLEYAWGIYVDSDSNPFTGNFDGFDVSIELNNFKSPGSAPFNGSILDVELKCTWIWVDDIGYYGHPIDAYIDTLARSLIMVAPRVWTEMANVDELDRFYFWTYYWSPSGVESDYTEESSGTNYIWDPQGDVPYSFIDILGGSLSVPVTGISEELVPDVPQTSALNQNFPNPFRARTAISFSLPHGIQTTLTIYDVCGMTITTLVDKELSAGVHTLDWDADAPSGIYFYRLEAGDFTDMKKMILLR